MVNCPICSYHLNEFILPRLGTTLLKCSACGFKIGKDKPYPSPRYSIGKYDKEPPF